jgi:hypothetical protein
MGYFFHRKTGGDAISIVPSETSRILEIGSEKDIRHAFVSTEKVLAQCELFGTHIHQCSICECDYEECTNPECKLSEGVVAYDYTCMTCLIDY